MPNSIKNFSAKKLICKFVLLILTLHLAACGTRSKAPQKATIPPPPAELMQAEPSGSYLDSVQQLLQDWRKKLIDSKAS